MRSGEIKAKKGYKLGYLRHRQCRLRGRPSFNNVKQNKPLRPLPPLITFFVYFFVFFSRCKKHGQLRLPPPRTELKDGPWVNCRLNFIWETRWGPRCPENSLNQTSLILPWFSKSATWIFPSSNRLFSGTHKHCTDFSMEHRNNACDNIIALNKMLYW